MTTEDAELVLEARRGPVLRLTLNRPDAMNALSRALRRRLTGALRAAEADEEVRVVVITGAGERAFSAGLDLKELERDPDALGLGSDAAAQDPVLALSEMTKPSIAAVNGVAVTGGFELALNCDILLAGPEARFADTHGKVGVMPGWGLSQKLPRLIGLSRAKEVSLGGAFVDAETACAWGLVNRVSAPGRVAEDAMALGLRIARADPEWLGAVKGLMDAGWNETLGDAMAREARAAADWNGRWKPEGRTAVGRGRSGSAA